MRQAALSAALSQQLSYRLLDVTALQQLRRRRQLLEVRRDEDELAVDVDHCRLVLALGELLGEPLVPAVAARHQRLFHVRVELSGSRHHNY